MPTPIMKTKLSAGSIKEKGCLGVSQKSSIISKKPCSHVNVSQQAAELDMLIQEFQDDYVTSTTQLSTGEMETDLANDDTDYSGDGDSQSHDKPCMLADSCCAERDSQSHDKSCMLADSCCAERMESVNNNTPNFETIFSPSVEPVESSDEPKLDEDAGSNKDHIGLGIDDGDDDACGYQACNISDFFISDTLIASLPFDGGVVYDDVDEMNALPDYKCAEPGRLFDMAEECLALPLLKETTKDNKSIDIEPCQESLNDGNNDNLHLAINQIRSSKQVFDLKTDLDHAEDVDPQLFIEKFPELSEVVLNFHPVAHQKEPQRRKSVTLVLDLDETLVHSTLEDCGYADFTFNVFFNMKEHTVYVKQRPHLHTFLERVAEMFEVIVFTASQSIYAEQLLDILDPEGKLISRRVYRESCIFSDGSYTKDLTVLGVDLAKVAIVDNSPQVFRLQVNNGIPITSWFSDTSDCALISLLPFLETLVDADDVRPLIASRFGNRE